VSPTRRRRTAHLAVAGLSLGGLAALCWTRRDDLGAALEAVSPAAFAALVALHLVTLGARSEAWRLVLAAVEGQTIPRRAVHGANAGAFVAGAMEAHLGMPVRIALLKQLAPRQAPRATQIAVADLPILLLEICGAAAVLAVGAAAAGPWPWWTAPAALAVAGAGLAAGLLALARLGPHRPMARGLAVLGCRVRRGPLAALVALVTACGVARVSVALAACGLPAGPGEIAVVFASLGVLGLLPLGPSASPGATLAVVGSAGVGAALAAGLAISASAILSVLLYAGALLALRLRDRAQARRQVVSRNRAETVGGGARDEVGLGHGAGADEPLGLQPIAVVGMVPDGAREVRATQGRAADRAGVDRGAVQREAALRKRRQHPFAPRVAVLPKLAQGGDERRRVVVGEVGADVQILPSAVERGELRRRDHAESEGLPARRRLVDAVHRIMVRQR